MANLSRRDVIIGCVVGFIAWLWTVHFLPSLRFVPHAFLLGSLSTAGFAAYVILTTSQAPAAASGATPRETSFIGLTQTGTWHREVSKLARRSEYTPGRLHGRSRRISRRLDHFLDLILRDFVKTWYIKISSGSTFCNEIDRAIRASLGQILNIVLHVDLVEFGVTRLLPIVHRHVERYAEAERLVRGKRNNVESMTAQELEITIAQRYRDGKLHPAATLSPSKALAHQQQHLRRLVGRMLSVVMPSNMQSSAAVLTLVKEMVACAVLLPVLSLTADPDVLNQLIETYGRSVLHERRTVRKFRAALDEQASPTSHASSLPKLRHGDSERSFEAFSKKIKACDSLSDAKSFEQAIVEQIKREGASSKRDPTHLRRLEIGRKLVEQRLEELTNDAGSTQTGLWNLPLRDLLYDASGLAYFMEWMFELNTITLVQFWIVADGFRNNSTKSFKAPGKQQPAWIQSDRDLLVQISGRYLWKPELQVPQSTQDVVNVYLNNGDAASPQQYSRARLAVLELQDSVYAKMEKELLSKFKASELFRRWAGVPEKKAAKSEVNGRPEPASQADISPMPARVDHVKKPELRRAVASHSDIAKAARKATLATAEPRRSFDESRDRQPLFDGEPADDPLARSTASLDSMNEEGANLKDVEQRNVMHAARAALDEAMDAEVNDQASFDNWGSESLELPQESPLPSIDEETTTAPLEVNGNRKPSLSSLGLVGTPSRRTVFSNGDLFGENEKTLLEDDEANETDATNKTDEDDDIHEAAPGDLGLSELVQGLTLQIEKLEAQQKVVDSLVEKAELTNNAAELRILKKSKASLERELHRKELQRQQYLVQKSENDLYGRADVAIKSIMVGKEPDGREFALYVIEVTRHGSEKSPPVTWAITRRYSEFHDLHRRLRKRYPPVRDLEFPRRQVVLTLQKDFLKKRGTALEKYLRELLVRPQVCRSIEFRAFLSQQSIRPVSGNGQTLDRQDFITRIYSSVTDGMEEFIGNVPVLDQLSAAGQSIITAASTYATQPPPTSSNISPSTPYRSPTSATNPSTDLDSPRANAEAQAEISAFESRTDPETVTFIKPICDIFLELFQLNQGNSWLRGRAVVVVTQQLLGGTIERKVRETFKAYTSEGSICRYLDMAMDLMWPDGVFRQKPPDRTAEEKETSRKNAAIVLQTLLPDLAGGVVGRGNAVSAAKRVGAMCNNEVLNKHLVYCLLDEVVEGLLGVRVTAR